MDFFEEEDIQIGIFTKGIIFGDDEIAQRIFGMSSEELCKKVAGYKCVTLLIGFISANPAVEHSRLKTSIKNFSAKRNLGIERMAALGLNSDPKSQRLTLVCAPVLRDNVAEALAIFKWGVMRNIPTVIAPTMVSGKGLSMPEVHDAEFKDGLLVELYTNVYKWLIQRGIMTVDQIEGEGISPYPGFACNQFVSGMFIRKDGRAQGCPGNETAPFRYAADVRGRDLKEIWTGSLGYRLRAQLIESGNLTVTQPCYAKTEGDLVPCGSISKGFYEEVLRRVKASF